MKKARKEKEGEALLLVAIVIQKGGENQNGRGRGRIGSGRRSGFNILQTKIEAIFRSKMQSVQSFSAASWEPFGESPPLENTMRRVISDVGGGVAALRGKRTLPTRLDKN